MGLRNHKADSGDGGEKRLARRCEAPGCNRPLIRSYCSKHARQLRVYGHLAVRLRLITRLPNVRASSGLEETLAPPSGRPLLAP